MTRCFDYMGLFSIFKKEPEPTVVPKDSIKGLANGILFEGDGVFLRWGSDIEADKLYIKKEYRADRTIYHWGERSILNSLKLPFKTVCWNHKQHGETKSFESIEFSIESPDAEKYFRSVNEHIEAIFGVPKRNEDVHPDDISLEWRIKPVKISLSLYNKEYPKLNFEVGCWL